MLGTCNNAICMACIYKIEGNNDLLFHHRVVFCTCILYAVLFSSHPFRLSFHNIVCAPRNTHSASNTMHIRIILNVIFLFVAHSKHIFFMVKDFYFCLESFALSSEKWKWCICNVYTTVIVVQVHLYAEQECQSCCIMHNAHSTRNTQLPEVATNNRPHVIRAFECTYAGCNLFASPLFIHVHIGAVSATIKYSGPNDKPLLWKIRTISFSSAAFQLPFAASQQTNY